MQDHQQNTPLTLTYHDQQITILPHMGAALQSWTYQESDILRPVSNPNLTAFQGEAIGAYPLFPYSNRIKDGKFSFAEQDFTLVKNMEGCPHPIHGNSWENSWHIAHHAPSHAVLIFDHLPKSEEEKQAWPFAYRAVLSYALRADGLEVSLVIENHDTKEQPVGFGFHPFFAIHEESTISFRAGHIWEMQEDGLPLQAHPCRGEYNFSDDKLLKNSAFDTIFSDFEGHISLKNPQTRHQILIEADPIFEHMVMFKEKSGNFVALEPVTNMTNAHNMPETAPRGLHILKEKGHSQSRIGGVIRFIVKKL